MDNNKDSRIKEQLILNEKFKSNEYRTDYNKLIEEKKLQLADKLMNVTAEYLQEMQVTIVRMLDNVLNYIETGKTRWGDTDLYTECVGCDKVILKIDAIRDTEGNIDYCNECANKLGI